MPQMDNLEEVLLELNEFIRHVPSSPPSSGVSSALSVPQVLEDYLAQVARTGDPIFPWHKVKPLVKHKLATAIDNFHETCPAGSLPVCPNSDPFCYDDMRLKILKQLDSFNGAPFTIQRLCELLVQPNKHYKRTDKFMRGVEKNVLVVSVIEPSGGSSENPPPSSPSLTVAATFETQKDREMPAVNGIEDDEEPVQAEATTTVQEATPTESSVKVEPIEEPMDVDTPDRLGQAESIEDCQIPEEQEPVQEEEEPVQEEEEEPVQEEEESVQEEEDPVQEEEEPVQGEDEPLQEEEEEPVQGEEESEKTEEPKHVTCTDDTEPQKEETEKSIEDDESPPISSAPTELEQESAPEVAPENVCSEGENELQGKDEAQLEAEALEEKIVPEVENGSGDAPVISESL